MTSNAALITIPLPRPYVGVACYKRQLQALQRRGRLTDAQTRARLDQARAVSDINAGNWRAAA